MNKYLSYLKYIPLIIVLLLCLYGVYHYWQSSRQLEALLKTKTTELMLSDLSLGRAKTTLFDATSRLKQLEKAVQKEIADRKATLTLYAELEAKYRVEKLKQKTITRVIYQDREIDLPAGKLFVKLDDGNYKQIDSLTYNYKDFRITINGDVVKKTLSYQLHQKFKAILVESRVPGGAINHYANLYEIDEHGNQLRLELIDFTVVRSPELPPKMMWWDPKLDLMLGGGITHKIGGIWTADVGISTSAYGRTPDDISWRFLRLGLGITGSGGLSATLSPAQYNLGKQLPLVSNLWITPYIGYDFINQLAHFGAGISVVF